MTYGSDFDGFVLDAINNPVISVNLLPEVFIIVLRDDSATFLKIGDFFDEPNYSFGKKSGIVLRIF